MEYVESSNCGPMAVSLMPQMQHVHGSPTSLHGMTQQFMRCGSVGLGMNLGAPTPAQSPLPNQLNGQPLHQFLQFSDSGPMNSTTPHSVQLQPINCHGQLVMNNEAQWQMSSQQHSLPSHMALTPQHVISNGSSINCNSSGVIQMAGQPLGPPPPPSHIILQQGMGPPHHLPHHGASLGPPGFRPRFGPCMAMPDVRIHEMNKRLQQRPESEPDNLNLWWDNFATEFFEDDSMLTLTFMLEDGPKRYTIGRTLIPRYFRSIFEGGVVDFYLILRSARESFHSTNITLDCDRAELVSTHLKPILTKVVTEGRLVLEFTFDDLMRIRTWHMQIRNHREMIPRQILSLQQGPTMLDQVGKNITRQGLTNHTLNFLRLCVILEPMQELMSRQKAYGLLPRDCLKTTLFQKWQRMVSPPEATRQPSKRRKRKTTTGNSDGNGRGKRKPSVTTPVSNNLVQSGDVMIVGEPTLMGGDFGEEDERLITRLENSQFDSNHIFAPPVSSTFETSNATQLSRSTAQQSVPGALPCTTVANVSEIETSNSSSQTQTSVTTSNSQLNGYSSIPQQRPPSQTSHSNTSALFRNSNSPTENNDLFQQTTVKVTPCTSAATVTTHLLHQQSSAAVSTAVSSTNYNLSNSSMPIMSLSKESKDIFVEDKLQASPLSSQNLHQSSVAAI